MPTTFIGRDNNNNPCYHVRKGNGLSLADMKQGVQDDTLFHSSLPYLNVITRASTSLTSTFTRTGTQHVNEKYYIFNIPSSIKAYLLNNYTCICIVTWSTGAKSLINIATHITTWKRYRSNIGARGSAVSNVPFPIADSSGWWALNYTPTNSGLGVSGGLLDSTQYIGEAYTSSSATLNNSNPNFLNKDSQCLVFQSGNGAVPFNMYYNQAEYATSPVPSSVEFLIMNSTVSTGLNFLGVGAITGDIKIQRDGLLINGINILAGKTFLTTDVLNITKSTTVASGSFAGEVKLNTLTLPNSVPPFSYRHKASYDSNDNVTANTAGGVSPAVLAVNGVTVDRYGYYRVGNYYSSTGSGSLPGYQSHVSYVESALPYYYADSFILKTIPNDVSSCIFARDSLSVNGIEFFNTNTSLIRGSTSGAASIDVPVYSYTGSTVGITETILNTFSVAAQNTNLIMFYNVNKFTINNLTGYDTITGGTITLTPTARQYTDNLNMKLICLTEGQYCHLITFSDIYESTAGTNSVIVTYCFKRVGNTVKLIRHVTITDNQGTSTINIPGFRVNYMQLASAF